MNNLENIIKKYGTPCYIFDLDILKNRISYLKNKFGRKYDLVYAVKANTFIIKGLENIVERFEICSPGEYHICSKLKISHNKMVISGVYKDYETIDEIFKEKEDILKYTVESINQYDLLKELCHKYNKKIHVLIRLTSGNQFGVTKEELKELIKNNDELIIIDGIEFFSGTQKHSLRVIEKEIDHLNELIANLKEEYSFSVQEIEYGPGLPVFYFQDDEFNEDEFLNNIKIIIDKLKVPKVTLEIGRSIASSCGYYASKVVDMKTNKFGNYAILDGGINHLVYYGQTMAMKIPHYEIIPQKENNDKEIYNLCGSLCTINDYLVKNIETRKLSLGDTFIFKNVGAYSSTEGISLFLSRDLPKIILILNKQDMLVRDKIRTSDLNFPNIKE